VNNIFIGRNAGTACTSGYANIAIGDSALTALTTANSDFAVGLEALKVCTTGSSNFGLGAQSLYSVVTGSQNTGIGAGALYSVTGDNNFGLGLNAGYKLAPGVANTIIGIYAAGQTSTAWAGEQNVFIGWQCAYNIATARYFNVCIGNRSGYNINGNLNTFIGHNAGYNNTGSGSVLIGQQAGYNETGSNKLYIENSNSASPLIYGEFDTNLVRVNGAFEVNQASTSAAVPVAKLTQADVDDSFIDYVGTSAADATKSISTLTAGNSIQGFFRIEINGVTQWMPYYDAPTS
jgi:hypothetical protein